MPKTPNEPLSAFVWGAICENYATPDMLELQHKYKHVPVFLYGAEKCRFEDNAMLEGSVRLGIGYTHSSIYQMYMTEESGMVVALNPDKGLNKARIQGEVFLVSVDVLAKLDEYYENGSSFHRLPAHVKYLPPYQLSSTSKEERIFKLSGCLMYQGSTSFWFDSNRKKENLVLMSPLTANDLSIGAYYTYTKADEERVTAKRKNRRGIT